MMRGFKGFALKFDNSLNRPCALRYGHFPQPLVFRLLGTDFDRKSKRKAEKDNAQHTRPPSQVKQSAFPSKDYSGRFRHCKGENLQNLQRAAAGEFAGSTELIAAAGSLLLGLCAHILVSEFTLLRFLWLALTGFVPVA